MKQRDSRVSDMNKDEVGILSFLIPYFQLTLFLRKLTLRPTYNNVGKEDDDGLVFPCVARGQGMRRYTLFLSLSLPRASERNE